MPHNVERERKEKEAFFNISPQLQFLNVTFSFFENFDSAAQTRRICEFIYIF